MRPLYNSEGLPIGMAYDDGVYSLDGDLYATTVGRVDDEEQTHDIHGQYFAHVLGDRLYRKVGFTRVVGVRPVAPRIDPVAFEPVDPQDVPEGYEDV